jgi:hypothetical protein
MNIVKTKIRKTGAAFAALALLALMSCDGKDPPGAGGMGGGGGQNPSGTGGMGGGGGQAPIEPSKTSLFMEIVDRDWKPFPSVVAISRGSEAPRPTNGAGQILFENLVAGRFVARAEVFGYAPMDIVANLPAGVHGGVRAPMVPLGPRRSFDDAKPAVLDGPGYRITIDADSLMHEDGEDVTGLFDATVVLLDPTTDLALAPAPLEALRISGEAVNLEPFSLIEISVFQGGARLDLKPGKPAAAELVVPGALAGKVTAGQPFRGFWLDLDAGLWREDTFGTIKPYSQDTTKLAWAGPLPHFTWWTDAIDALDAAENSDRNCFQVTLTDPTGAAWPGQKIDPIPTNFEGRPTPQYTAEGGNACVNIKHLASANLKAGNDTASPLREVPITGMGLASACGVPNVACQAIAIQSAKPRVCTPGARQTCPYSGDPTKLNVGICQASTNYCNVDGTAWLGCMGEVTPQTETCNSVFDDDCNDMANEAGTSCVCVSGATKAGDCYTGSPSTLNKGVCVPGTSTCNKNGTGYTCKNQIIPAREACGTPEDEDCDQSVYCSWWSKRAGDPGVQRALAAEFDPMGNLLVVGQFSGTLALGGQTLQNPSGMSDAGFVAKFNTAGTMLWVKGFTGGTSVQVHGVAIDSMSNILLTGRCSGMVDLGDGVQACPGSSVFLAKLDASGNHLFNKRFAAGSTLETVDIALDGAGNIVLTGGSNGTANFGKGNLPTFGDRDVFVAKFDPSGVALWSKSFGDLGFDVAPGIAIDTMDNIVIAGHFQRKINFSASPATELTNADTIGFSPDIFVAKLAGDGSHLWSKRYGDANIQRGVAIAVDKANDIVVTGDFNSTLNFSGQPEDKMTSAGGTDIWIAKLAGQTGAHVWSKRFGGTTNDIGKAVSVDASGAVLLTGRFEGTADFGAGNVTAQGSDMFVVKLASVGGPVQSFWAHDLKGSGDEVGTATAVDGSGNIGVVGNGSSLALDFGNGPLFGSTDDDIFIARLSP